MPQRAPSFVPGVFACLFAAVALLSSSVEPAAGDCIAAPDAKTPEGSHWYYRIDHASGRKCWHLGPQGQDVRQAVAAITRASPKPSTQTSGTADPIEPLPAHSDAKVPTTEMQASATAAETEQAGAPVG